MTSPLLKTLTASAPSRLPSEDLAHLTKLLFAETNERLKPPRHVFAVLDGGRDESIVRRVKECPGLRECLYRDVTDPELLEVAPWLVELSPTDEWTRELLLDSWGRSWGIFVEAALPPVALVRHLRTFLKARDELGRTLLFRYYDPRVWRVYAPTCTAEEAQKLIGPMDRILCEAEAPRTLLEWTRTPTGFGERALSFPDGDLTAPVA